ncbi:MAG TPA: ParA family protein [Verrucomicrobiae bacterium]|nr:ParA family protein [Verrucomicrobiae bacterium]
MNYPYVIAVSSEKGGVGKTTLATNLAVYLKAMREDLPVSIFSFDNHFTVDKMFCIREGNRGTVADLLLETRGDQLLHTGQYGISYIPSSDSLADLKQAVRSPMVLARLLCTSNIPGIIIIDTRPDLDILTQNAIYAADRVIIPVKDMPSLENCRNIFDLFDRRGLDRKSLTLIPCLIDSRIKYEGPFRDQKELLRAYAVNRGYRCMNTFISKSPKVESLNTNPDGKVYPILTHARGTDVHAQFTQVARQLLADFDETPEPRSILFHRWLVEEDGRKKEAFLARLSGLKRECLVCAGATPEEVPGSFYFETSDGGSCGFLHESCFLEILMSHVYELEKKFGQEDPTWQMFRSSSRESAFTFHAAGEGTGECRRLDMTGGELARKRFQLRAQNGSFFSREKNKLFTLLRDTLGDHADGWRDAFLLVWPADEAEPASVLSEERYQGVRKVLRRASTAQ